MSFVFLQNGLTKDHRDRDPFSVPSAAQMLAVGEQLGSAVQAKQLVPNLPMKSREASGEIRRGESL